MCGHCESQPQTARAATNPAINQSISSLCTSSLCPLCPRLQEVKKARKKARKEAHKEAVEQKRSAIDSMLASMTEQEREQWHSKNKVQLRRGVGSSCAGMLRCHHTACALTRLSSSWEVLCMCQLDLTTRKLTPSPHAHTPPTVSVLTPLCPLPALSTGEAAADGGRAGCDKGTAPAGNSADSALRQPAAPCCFWPAEQLISILGRMPSEPSEPPLPPLTFHTHPPTVQPHTQTHTTQHAHHNRPCQLPTRS